MKTSMPDKDEYTNRWLDCAMCGAGQAFMIDADDPAVGYCRVEDKHWRIEPGPLSGPTRREVMDWISCDKQLPPNDVEVMTKIDDGKGVRNKQTLKRQGRLWFFPDDSMYVYYTPTHWAELGENWQSGTRR